MHNKSVWTTKRIFLCTKSIGVLKYTNFYFSTSMKSCSFASITTMSHQLHHSALLPKQLLSLQQQRCFVNFNNYTNNNNPIRINTWCPQQSFSISSIGHCEFDAKISDNKQKDNLLIKAQNRTNSNIGKMLNCNKEFNFNNYDIIGFDLDCTLLRYNLNEMVPLVHNLLQKFLVEEKGYPCELLAKKFNSEFIQKGLILDAENGNVLKLSKDATILRAAHGTRMLTAMEIVNIYGPKRQWDIATQYCENPMSTWNGPLSEKMRTLLDYFDISSSLVFAQAVDVLDETKRQCITTTKYNIWPDILDGHLQLYAREQFANGKSGYFNALINEPERYVLRTNDKVINWLKDLRAAGKSLFLLTGSNVNFANLTATYALGKNWKQLFDVIVCYGRKPGFFTMEREFLCVDDVQLQEIENSEIDIETELTIGHGNDVKNKSAIIYSQGNWKQLRNALAQMQGKDNNDVRALYVGDNLIQDVYSPVVYHDMDSVALSEELLAESGSKYDFKEIVISNLWGSYFKVNSEPTFWSAILENYTKLCITSMDAVADKKINENILCDNTVGYFPIAPKISTTELND